MSAVGEAARPRSRRLIAWWRWTGRPMLLVLLIFTFVPKLWMVLTSVKSQFAAMQYPPQWWPAEPTLENYRKLLDPTNSVGQEFLRYFANSLYVSVATTILGVVVAGPAW